MPPRPLWRVSWAEGTYYCEFRDWMAEVTPDRYQGHPGWGIAVWLRGREPDGETGHDHVSSDGEPGMSLVRALQCAERLIDAQANGSET